MATTVYNISEIEDKTYLCDSRKILFNSFEFQDLFFSHLDRKIIDNTILSLDVFDTFVLRDGSSEVTRFYEIGERISEEISSTVSDQGKNKVNPADAFLARYFGTIASYRASQKRDGCREGSLREIHETASKMLGVVGMADRFIEIELAYEATRIEPNQMLLNYVRRHRERGGQVILVSDMYMHADHIQQLLIKVGIDENLYDRIFSSADEKVSKASGGIFKLIENDLSALPGRFFHIGDSLKGDFRQPLACGWSAMHLPVAQLEIEMRRNDHYVTTEKLRIDHSISVDIAVPF